MADSLKDELAAKQAATGAAGTTGSTTASSVAESGVMSMPAYADKTRVDAINQMYDANVNAQKANLQTSYDQNLSNYEANRESIAKRYQTARNTAATDYERQRRNFNEQAMMNGLATGVGSQASLAQNAAYQRQQGKINAAEGTDVSTLERNIADLKVKYQNDINSAVADNDYKRAAALLDEYNTAYSRAQQEAQTKASYGDFSGYATLFGEETANQMRDIWMRQNPGIAYSLGYINANTYYALTGRYPAGYSSGGGGGRSYGGSWSGSGLTLEGQTPAADPDRLSGPTTSGGLNAVNASTAAAYNAAAAAQSADRNGTSNASVNARVQAHNAQVAAANAAAQAQAAAQQRAAQSAAVRSIANYNYDGSTRG